MSHLHRAAWVMSTIASAGELFLTLFYWAVLYDPDKSNLSYWNFLVHGLAYIIMLIDIFVSARPWRWQHFYIAALVAVA